VREQALTASQTSQELLDLSHALRGALGTLKDDAAPVPSADWRDGWAQLADIGIAGFCAPEAIGGFGLRVDAATVAATELGSALHGSPYAGLMASCHALAASNDTEAVHLAADIVSGARIATFGRLDATGSRAYGVDGASTADALVLVAPNGEFVLVVDRAAWAVAPGRKAFDVSRAIDDVTVDIGGARRLPADPLALALGGLLLAADAAGNVRHAVDRTVAYARERQAFGKAIGGFQAVQHRLVEHAVRAGGMALVVSEAARLLGAGDDDALRMVAMAEVAVSSSSTHIVHDLLQLTGGIGFTWEYGLHLHERRVHEDARLAANPRAATRALAEREGWTNA
jgi:alkylation response protein AidB-like acyl-CoA dehydrogenase